MSDRPNSPASPASRPVGESLSHWNSPGFPERETITGDYCRLEPLEADRHAEELFRAFSEDKEGHNWTYLPYGPFRDATDWWEWVETRAGSRDPLLYAVVYPETAVAVGVLAFLRIDPNNGALELGHIHFSEILKRSRASTEALFLMMDRAFALGYRRLEWKCDSLNEPSRQAAIRLGFSFEGVFRQHAIYKGRNRDTAWYSILDREWPPLQGAFRHWLDPQNFEIRGIQIERLSELTRLARSSCG